MMGSEDSNSGSNFVQTFTMKTCKSRRDMSKTVRLGPKDRNFGQERGSLMSRMTLL